MNDFTLPETHARRTATLVLLCIIMVGLLLRLIHFWALVGTTLPFRHQAQTVSDDYAFVQWAQTVLAGDWLGRDTYHPYFLWMQEIAPLETWYHWWGGKEIFHQAPLYPYVLAALLAVTWGSFPIVLLVQLLVGALQPLVLYHLGSRLWNCRVGLAAAAISALYGPFIFHGGVFLRDWLPPLLEPLALIAVLKAKEQDSSLRWIVAGMALGLALLARETAILLILFVLLWSLSRSELRRAAWTVSCMAVGLVLALSPLLFRNAAVGAPVFALSNRAAEGIIEGWAADGYPVGQYIPLSMKDILIRSDGKLPGVIQATMDTYRADWWQLLQHAVVKLRGMSDPFEFPNNVSFYYGMDFSPILRFTLGYGFVFSLGVAGFLMGLKTSRQHALGVVYVMAAAGGLLATIILARYRLELASGLILYAAVLLGQLMDAARQRRIRKIILGMVVAALVGFAQQVILPLGPEVKDYAFSTDYTSSAAVYAERRQFGHAVAVIGRALDKVAEHPDFQVILTGTDGTRVRYFNDVTSLVLQYHFYRAYQLLEEGVIADAWREAEIVRETMGQLAITDANRLYALAHLYLRLKDTTRARELLEKLLDVDPNGPFGADARRLLSGLSSQAREQK